MYGASPTLHVGVFLVGPFLGRCVLGHDCVCLEIQFCFDIPFTGKNISIFHRAIAKRIVDDKSNSSSLGGKACIKHAIV
jgi:hypothetical protein